MSEDIEKKIKRLRELGRASAEAELSKAATPPVPVKKPPKKRRSMGSIKERERRKRIIVGATIILIIILAVSIGAYVYLQNRATWELENAKSRKLAELNTYFKPGSELMNSTIGKEAYTELRNRILAAKSIDEVNAIDIKAAYTEAMDKYQAYIAEQKQIEYEKQLNRTKQEKVKLIELEFQPLLSMPLPDDLKKKAVDVLANLEDRVMSATSMEQVNSTNPAPYLLELWRDYYFYLVDSVQTQSVILEKNGVKRILSKTEAKSILGSITDYRELMGYRVYRVEYVDIALVLPRDRINGAFLSPGDKVMIFAKNGTSSFKEIANEGYIELVLLPRDAGVISVSEAQSQTTSSNTASSNQYSEQHQSEYQPGGSAVTNSQRTSDVYTSEQSSSQSASASYSYSVDLTEILKAIAAGKIQASEDVKEQLRAYGWEVVDLEKESGMLVLDPNAQFLVILKVPSIFVPDILSNQQTIYIAKVTT
ncbi:DUF515 domain-containing protein [Thermococcus sp. M36]|nr:DUF515 domain-containing protein [Thermococcus sp. M36]